MLDNNKTKEKNPEEKNYLVCIKEENGDNYWEVLTGRTEAYEFCKSYVGVIDFDRSFILVDGVKFEDRKTIYAFLKYASNFYEDNFNVDDYIYDDKYQIQNSIDEDLIVDSDTKLSIFDILNGGEL